MASLRYNLLFKGIRCSIWIKSSNGERYQILIRTNKKLSLNEQAALQNYLVQEGYIDTNNFTFE